MGSGIFGDAFRAYLTEPESLPALIELEGLPGELRHVLRRRLRS
ncbi:hypothetical protein [Micromonospora sp. WMMD812]|nr:hypothetical protein [Micromonospora sp. WMMD812]WBB67701.1 hypothetical protein O7603_32305 [Micromonospora sp. WMMD812]